jgi:murein DD-endopeptidase MepM/ murein hydrolase activator NlpD
MTYAGVVSDQTDDAIERYTEVQAEAEVLRTEAEEAADAAVEARDEVETRRDALHVERERQAQAQADAFVAALAQQGLIAEIEAQRGSYEQRLRTLSGTSDSINGVLRSRQEGQRLPDRTEGILLPPVPNPEISSPFGPRLHPIFGTVRMHNGTDLDAAMGTPIRASASGEVVVAGWQGGYGFTVVIDHGNGLATLYAHQSSIIVLEGQQVEMGDTIGLVGSTGWSTGPHLHWEVRVFGNPTEPLAFMGGEELLWFAAALASGDDEED